MRPTTKLWAGLLAMLPVGLALPAQQGPADAPPTRSEHREQLLKQARTNPRQAVTQARRLDQGPTKDEPLAPELEKQLELALQKRLGKEQPVNLKTLHAHLRTLPIDERREQLRDLALMAAYSQMDPDPDQAQFALGTRPPLRQPHLAGLLEFELGPGRIAALDKDEYLVVLPETPAKDKGAPGYDVRALCRLVDERSCADLRRPAAVRVVVYKAAPDEDAPRLSVRYRHTIPGALLYDPKGGYGFVSRVVDGLAGLKAFLKEADDLLLVSPVGGALLLEGRAFGADRLPLKYHRIDLDDLAVLYQSVAKPDYAQRAELRLRQRGALMGLKLAEQEKRIKEEERFLRLVGGTDDLKVERFAELSLRARDVNFDDLPKKEKVKRIEQAVQLLRSMSADSIGFSLDPWVMTAPLTKRWEEHKKRSAREKRPLPPDLARQLDEALENLAEADDAWPAPRSLAQDRLKVHTFVENLKRATDKAADTVRRARAGERDKALRELQSLERHEQQLLASLQDCEVAAARYDGEFQGTEVGMTLFYCDAIAKIFAWGRLLGHGQVLGIPKIEGLKTWQEIDAAGFHVEELHKTKKGRLWWGLRPSGLVDEDGPRTRALRFAPAAARIFFKVQESTWAQEKEPNIVWATFANSWNRRYLEVADHEPEFHRLNQIMKWSAALVWSKDRKALANWEFLDNHKPAAVNLQFESWHKAALKDKRVAIKAPFRFKDLKAVPTEALERQISEYYQVARVARFGWRGGVTTPRVEEIRQRVVKSPVTPGLPAGIKAPTWKGVGPKGEVKVDLIDGRKLAGKSGAGRSLEVSRKLDRPLRTTSFEWSNKGKGAEATYRARLEIEPGKRSLKVEGTLAHDGAKAEAGSLAFVPGKEGGLTVNWRPAPVEEAQVLLRAVAQGQVLPAGAKSAVRYDKATNKLYVALESGKGWLEMTPGTALGGGGRLPPSPPGAFRVGTPGEPDFVFGRLVPSAPAGLTAIVAEPQHVRVRTTGADTVAVSPKWFAPSEAPALPLAKGGRVALFADGVVFPRSLLGNRAKELRPSEVRALESAALTESVRFLGIEAREVRLLGGGVLLVRGKDGFEALTAKDVARLEAKDRPLLSELGEGQDRRIYLRTTSKALPADSPRVRNGTLLEPERLTEKGRGELRDSLRILRDNPRLTRVAGNLEVLSPKGLRALGAEQARLDAPVVVRRGAGTGLVFEVGGRKLDFRAALREVRADRALPAEWNELKGKAVLIDVRGLSSEEVSQLHQITAALEPKLGEGSNFYFKNTEASEGRLAALLEPGTVRVEADRSSLERVREVGPAAIEALEEMGKPLLSGSQPARELARRGDRVVDLLVAHYDGPGGAALTNINARVAAGDFNGRDLILFLCNRNSREVLGVAQEALRRGARSVTIAEGALDIRGGVLLAERLRRSPELLEAHGPTGALRQAGNRVARDLKDILKAADPAAALETSFGRKTRKLFEKPDGSLDLKLLKDLSEQIEREGLRLRQHVDCGKVRAPGLATARGRSPAARLAA